MFIIYPSQGIVLVLKMLKSSMEFEILAEIQKFMEMIFLKLEQIKSIYNLFLFINNISSIP